MAEVKGMTVFNTEDVDTKKQPMFFGKPLGVQRYDNFKYPQFENLTKQQLGYFWRPEEVSLQKDRGDYQSLRPEQKHIYTSNLKYQIMLDSVQGRAPGMAFLPYCSLPELEACMEVWSFMEMIHSRSYTYVIKNVYADPSDVFDKILNDNRILERAASVTESYDNFINYAQDYGQSNSWKPDMYGHPNSEWTRKDLKRHLYRAVANVNILEGIRFYVSFACSFAFGELKLTSELLPKNNYCDLLVLEAMASIYWRLFQNMQKINFNVLSEYQSKIRLGKWAKLAIGIQLRFLVKFKGYRPFYAR